MIKKVIFFLSFLLVGSIGFAQPQNTVEMADAFRADGKIYVVVGVMLLLFIGITFYLILIDRRLTKFENQIKSDE